MGIKQVITAPKSPWQNPYAERWIGSARRDCVDHCIILNELHLLQILKAYVHYYNSDRTHLGLNKDSPVHREVEPPKNGKVTARPILGGLHHRYFRNAS